MEPHSDWCSDHPLSTKVPFVRFDPADWTVPGNNQRVSDAVFQRSPIIIVVGCKLCTSSITFNPHFWSIKWTILQCLELRIRKRDGSKFLVRLPAIGPSRIRRRVRSWSLLILTARLQQAFPCRGWVLSGLAWATEPYYSSPSKQPLKLRHLHCFVQVWSITQSFFSLLFEKIIWFAFLLEGEGVGFHLFFKATPSSRSHALATSTGYAGRRPLPWLACHVARASDPQTRRLSRVTLSIVSGTSEIQGHHK